MKYYTTTTEFNCGIDLHARQMYVCIMDRQGKKLVHTNVKNNDFEFFLKLVQPYRHDLTVCCECMFGWYWLADKCHEAGLTFVLAHALYLRCIHGGKNKNDRIDSEKITHLLRSNLIPPSYVYPAQKRPMRALLRQRIFYVWRRAELLARIYSHQLAHNRTPMRQTTRNNRQPWEDQLLAAEDHPLRQFALQNDMAMIRHYDEQITALNTKLVNLANASSGRDFALLKSVPGIGENLGLTILHEIGDINRFPTVKDFLSYCRLVKGTVASAGKIKGLRGARLGNPYLRWAFGEAAVIAKRDHAVIGPLSQRPGGKNERQQVQGQHRRGDQDRPGRLLHAQKQNCLRPGPARGGPGQMISPWRQATRTSNWIRTNRDAPMRRRPSLLAHDRHHGLRWAHQESGRFDWDLSPEAIMPQDSDRRGREL